MWKKLALDPGGEVGPVSEFCSWRLPLPAPSHPKFSKLQTLGPLSDCPSHSLPSSEQLLKPPHPGPN